MDPSLNRLESDQLEPKHRENPKKSSNIISSIFLWWVGELLVIGNKRPLDTTDLFPLLDEDKTKTCTENLQHTWNEETTTRFSQKRENGLRLLKALIRTIPLTEYLFVFSMCLLSSVCTVLQPVFLSQLLIELMTSSAKESWWAYIFGAGICLSAFVRSISQHHWEYNTALQGLRWKSATIGIVYRKLLHLRQSEISRITCGFVINLIAGDLQRVEQSVAGFVFLMQAIFESCGTTLLMLFLFGWRPFSGALLLVIFSLYYGMMGRVLATLRSNISKVADSRVNMMNSIITGIRTVKMFAWERQFMERVQRIRRQEIQLIRWKTAILATFSSLIYTSTQIATCLSLVTLTTTGTALTSYNTFMILSLLSTLKIPMSWKICYSATVLADFAPALTRIQRLLEYQNNTNIHRYLEGTFARNTHSKRDSKLLLENVVCSWTGDWSKPTLKSVSLSAGKGDLVFITGRVGCGKSSLLYAVLDEVPVYKGKISCEGKIAWVGQQPWIFSGTIRDNILFEESFDPERYYMTLQACALVKDLSSFPNGDMTVVGERGVVLSGGQRARVELARAVYSNADVYLLDDPLSPVDSNVGRHLFDTCIDGLLQSKLRLMVTHNVEILKDAKHILVMEEGSVLLRGDFSLFWHSGLDFDAFRGKTDGKKAFPQQAEEAMMQERLTSFESLETTSTRFETAEEDRMIGSISWKLYWHHVQAGMHCILAIAMFSMFFVVQGSQILPDWWLLRLTSRSHDHQHQTKDLTIYCALVGVAVLLSIIRAAIFLNALVNSSKYLHNSMLTAVLKSPVLFFDTNPVGRILNRFSRDIGVMDESLPDEYLNAVEAVLFSAGAVVFPSILNPWIILPAVPLMFIFALIGRYYLKTSRELRRLEGISRSPVLSHFSDTMMGLVTIRAYRKENTFTETLFRHQDGHSLVWFSIFSTMRWLGIFVDMICVVFLVFVVFVAIATQSGTGVTALSLVYALQLAIDASQYGVKMCAEVENHMTSVERVITYTHIEQEPGYEYQHQPPENWPQHGQVRFENLGLVYYEGGPNILKDVSFTIDPHEKIGIAGRTGAGKSSLVSALFRMPQPTGHVIVDGVDIGDINLPRSRRAMSVITQNPILFTGSLRMNLDPFEEHDDGELWDALKQASLKSMVEVLPRQLNEEIKECGANFSVGERQLLCLARALLKKNKIIVMDEATANVDGKTDQLIQDTIRTKFKHCTVITIAHRLNTIIDYDRVLVLENGRLVEYDKPENLLHNERGQFLQLYHRYK